MATNPIGDNKTKTISMDPELYAATVEKWGKKKRYANFAKYIQHLIIEEMKARLELQPGRVAR